jgi:hypothetical protein
MTLSSEDGNSNFYFFINKQKDENFQCEQIGDLGVISLFTISTMGVSRRSRTDNPNRKTIEGGKYF